MRWKNRKKIWWKRKKPKQAKESDEKKGHYDDE